MGLSLKNKIKPSKSRSAHVAFLLIFLSVLASGKASAQTAPTSSTNATPASAKTDLEAKPTTTGTSSGNTSAPHQLQGKVEEIIDGQKCSVIVPKPEAVHGNENGTPVNAGIIAAYNRVILYTDEPPKEGASVTVEVYDAGTESIGSFTLHRYASDLSVAKKLRQESDALAAETSAASSAPSPIPAATALKQPAGNINTFVASKSDGGDLTGVPADTTTEMGRYKVKVYRAVGSRWYAKVSQLLQLLPPGSVHIQFTIHEDGTVATKVMDDDGSDKTRLLRTVSLNSIEQAAPFDRFSDSMRKEVGASYTDDFAFTVPNG